MDPYRLRQYSTKRPDEEVKLSPSTKVPPEPANIPHLQTPTSVRYAEWRTEPLAHSRPWALARHDGSPAAWAVYAMLGAATFLAGSIRPFERADDHLMWAWMGIAVTTFLLFSMYLERYGRRERERAARIEAMRDDGAAAQYAVRACFCRREEMFDSDEGLVSLVDGRLFFIGEQTTFSFSPRAAHLARGYAPGPRFEFLRYGVQFAVVFVPLGGSISAPRLAQEVHQFANGRIEPITVEALPPTRPSPVTALRVQARTIRSLQNAFAVLLLPNLFMLGALFSHPSLPPVDLLKTLLGTGFWLLLYAQIVLSIQRSKLKFLRELSDNDATFGVRRA